jgi:hypothetical protein
LTRDVCAPEKREGCNEGALEFEAAARALLLSTLRRRSATTAAGYAAAAVPLVLDSAARAFVT